MITNHDSENRIPMDTLVSVRKIDGNLFSFDHPEVLI